MTVDPRIEAAVEIIYVQNVDADDSGHFEPFHERKKEYYRAKVKAVLAAADAVDPLRRPGHRVEIAWFSWTLQHPAECRPDMLACPLTDALTQAGVSSVADGVWAVELHPDGYLTFSPDAVP